MEHVALRSLWSRFLCNMQRLTDYIQEYDFGVADIVVDDDDAFYILHNSRKSENKKSFIHFVEFWANAFHFNQLMDGWMDLFEYTRLLYTR